MNVFSCSNSQYMHYMHMKKLPKQLGLTLEFKSLCRIWKNVSGRAVPDNWLFHVKYKTCDGDGILCMLDMESKWISGEIESFVFMTFCNQIADLYGCKDEELFWKMPTKSIQRYFVKCQHMLKWIDKGLVTQRDTGGLVNWKQIAWHCYWCGFHAQWGTQEQIHPVFQKRVE